MTCSTCHHWRDIWPNGEGMYGRVTKLVDGAYRIIQIGHCFLRGRTVHEDATCQEHNSPTRQLRMGLEE